MYHKNRQNQEKFSNIQDLTHKVLNKVCPQSVNGTVESTHTPVLCKPRCNKLDREGFRQWLKGGNDTRGHNCPKRHGVVNYVINQINHYNNRFIDSYENIALKVGCKASYVKDVVVTLKQLGVIYTKRLYNSPLMYSLNPEMKDESTIKQFHPYLIGLRSFMSLVMLLSVLPGSLFSSSLKASKDKTSIILKEEFISSKLNNLDIHGKKGLGVKTSENRRHFTDKAKLSDIYPHLSSHFGRSIAVMLRQTPARSTWLSQVPERILADAYTQLFNDIKFGKKIKNRVHYLAGVIHKLCKENKIKVDYNLVPATIGLYDLDATWTQLTPEEISILDGKIRVVQEKFGIALEELRKKNPEIQLRREEAEKRKSDEAVRKGRTNPYSMYYTGNPFPLSNSLSTKTSIQGVSSESNPPIHSANPPQATDKVQLLNNPPALAPHEQCKKDIDNLRISLINMPPFMYEDMKKNFTNDLKNKFTFLPEDFDILTYKND